MGVPLLTLAVTAALPVVNVFVMCALGAALAWKGILDARARHLLSQLIFWIFVPALTFTTLADSVNLQNLAVWWILPFNVLFSICLGLAIGWIFGRIMGVDLWFRKHFICCVALGNVGNLPLVLVSSICGAETPFAAQLGPQCERLGIAYVAFGMWIASMFQYCVAYNMLKRPEEDFQQPSRKTVAGTSEVQLTGLLELSEDLAEEDEEGPASGKGRELQSLHPAERRWSHDTARLSRSASMGRGRHSLDELSVAEDGEDSNCGAAEEAQQEASISLLATGRVEHIDSQAADDASIPDHLSSSWQIMMERRGLLDRLQQLQSRVYSIPWGSYLNCPTLAAIAGLTVGCVSILKRLLFGDAPPLLFVTQSLDTMAGGMIPCMMLLLGASLAGGPRTSRLPLQVVLGAVVVRLVVIPALGTGFVMGLFKLGVIRPPDLLFLLTLLLCHATPTAMNLQTVAVLRRNGEAEVSYLLCWQYLASLITIPIWMSLFVLLSAGSF